MYHGFLVLWSVAAVSQDLPNAPLGALHAATRPRKLAVANLRRKLRGASPRPAAFFKQLKLPRNPEIGLVGCDAVLDRGLGQVIDVAEGCLLVGHRLGVT